jgi:thiamine phosphate synthase YjbQ (UPF0047 family)
MKSRTEYLTFNIPARMGFVNITSQVAEVVRESGVQEGLVLVNPKHILTQYANRRTQHRTAPTSIACGDGLSCQGVR